MGSRGKSISVSARRLMEKSQISSHPAAEEKLLEASYKEALFDELRRDKVKFSEADTIFITRDQYGKITWLEKGNENVGLIHIKKNHASQFAKALGVKNSNIPSHIKAVIENGVIVRSKPDNGGTNRRYIYNGNYYTVIVTGSNGFIITAYPERKNGNSNGDN